MAFILVCWGFIIWMPVHICGLWCLHYPFRLSSHSRSLTAPNSTNSCSNAPLQIMLDIFRPFVREIFTKIPLIGRQVRTVLWRKSEFVWAGKSFWLAGDAGCWIIAAGWFQSQHCRPNFHYQFVGRPPTAPYTPAYHILLRYANFSALHIDYTDSENSQYRRVDRCNIFSKAGQGSVMGGAICPDVLAWRDTGSSAAVALSST